MAPESACFREDLLLALTILIAVSAATAAKLTWQAALPLCLCILVVLPWTPLPVPDLFLVWTGPAVLLVWGGIALCMVAVVTAANGARALAVISDARQSASRCRRTRLHRIHVRAAGGGWATRRRRATLSARRPEPVKDGDIKVANNYQRQDYLEYWRGGLRAALLPSGRQRRSVSGHAPGLPTLIAPAFAIGGYWGTVVWVAMLTALGSCSYGELDTSSHETSARHGLLGQRSFSQLQ